MSADQIDLFLCQKNKLSGDTQRLNLLALSRVRGIGEASLKAFLKAYKDLRQVWDATPPELRQISSKAGLKLSENVIKDIADNRAKLEEGAKLDLEEFARQGIQLLTDLDEAFPQQLRDIDDPPRWLFVHGDVKLLSAPNLIAVVGTREASPRGTKRARKLTQWLAERGFGIVSGLAEGIDQAAHEAALDHGAPTIAVLGTGMSTVFPASTGQLRKHIIKAGGAVISEYFPQVSYSRQNFVRRNRIQAGLSFATVPVEAKERSGTAHTYRFAKTFNRVTFGIVNRDQPENGIVDLLRRDGKPVFTLEDPESMRDLEDLLRSALLGNPTQHKKALFETVLREFDRVLATGSVTRSDVKTLIAELTRRWEKTYRGGQSGRP
jgi:DNA protecting protein DprA